MDACTIPDAIICSICLEFVPQHQLFRLSICGCSFCRNCLVAYVSLIVQDRLDPSFPCPTYACLHNGHLTDFEIRTLLTPDLYTRYSVRKREREVETSASLTFCPAAGCGAICAVAAPTTESVPTQVVSRTSPGLVQRLAKWCGQRSNSKLTTVPQRRISFHLRNSVTKEDLETPDGQLNEPETELTSSTTPLRNKAVLCPSARVVCHQCGFIFCARCHMPWHDKQPVLCDPPRDKWGSGQPHVSLGRSTGSKQRRNFRNDSACTSIQTRPLLPQQNEVKSISESNIVPYKVDSAVPNTLPDSAAAPVSLKLPTTTQTLGPHSHSTKRKPRTGTRVGRGWKSHLVLPPSTPQSSSSTNVDLSMLAVGFPPYPPDAWLKRCPTCLVPIERVEGCAQMKCHSCKHTFCWYCLGSLDEDFLLKHYDSGACKGKLGHSRASIMGHRIYVIIVLVGLSLLLLLAAPFVVISVPCILCAKCHRVYLQRRLRERHANGMAPIGTNQSTVPKPDSTDKLPHLVEVEAAPNESKALNPVELTEKTIIAEKVDIHWVGSLLSSDPRLSQNVDASVA